MKASLPIPAFLFILAVSSPSLFEGDAAKGGQLGIAFVAAILAATLNIRYAVFEMLHLALGSRPSESTLFGVLLLVAAAGCIPLLIGRCKLWRQGRKFATFLGIAGLLLILLQPPLPFRVLLNLYDSQHSPVASRDTIPIFHALE